MGKKKNTAHKPNLLGQYYLEHVKLTSFGKFSNASVGPFRSGMNVVYGSNESGKTTLNELVKGVFFGWPSSRGQNNPYRPEQAERVGSLFFRDVATGEVAEAKRAKNSEGVQAPEELLADIDQETYNTIFALTSDELLHLNRHNEVTAHLLTAGSGTGSSPARALEEVNERIRFELSRSAKNPDSVPNLKEKRAQLRELVHRGREEADALRSQEQTLASLEPRRDLLAKTQVQLNGEIEDLKTLQAQLKELDASIEEARTSLRDALDDEERALLDGDSVPAELVGLLSLTKEEEYRLLDELDDCELRRGKLEHSLENARMDAVRSKSDYEVFSDQVYASDRKKQFAWQRRTKIAVAVAVTLAMALAGSFILYQSPSGGGLSYLVAGASLVVFALVIAVSGIAVALKPSQDEDELTEELKKRNWVVQQDGKTVSACQRALSDFDAEVAAFLDVNGLNAARGSLRRARRLLAELSEYRATSASARQHHQARSLQLAALRKNLAASRKKRIELCRAAGFVDNAAAKEVWQAISRKEQERDKTAKLAAETERQYGEISQRLATARSDTDFDAAKFECEQVEARLKETYRRLSVLFIAKRSLEAAIAEWERKSQPEVYARASRLFSQMTGGAWREIRMNSEGDLEVLDAVKTVRAPHLLSLGTRQQLYLSLRIALLLSATNVGKNLPVLCDDILVNFDDERRRGAAKALAELAQRRQVILFTCHFDVAALVRSVDPGSNLVEL